MPILQVLGDAFESALQWDKCMWWLPRVRTPCRFHAFHEYRNRISKNIIQNFITSTETLSSNNTTHHFKKSFSHFKQQQQKKDIPNECLEKSLHTYKTQQRNKSSTHDIQMPHFLYYALIYRCFIFNAYAQLSCMLSIFYVPFLLFF